MKVKICGITTLEDAIMCEEVGADALGFVHYPGRGRSLSLLEIGNICSTLGPLVTRALICCPDGPNEALYMMEKSGADVIQTYSLSPIFLSRLRESGVRVIRVVKPDINEARKYAEFADALVFEAGTPGTGHNYDYSTIPMDSCRRAIVAGGLTLSNIEYVKGLRPYGVDVSSGVESLPGRKDPELVKDFVRRCHN